MNMGQNEKNNDKTVVIKSDTKNVQRCCNTNIKNEGRDASPKGVACSQTSMMILLTE